MAEHFRPENGRLAIVDALPTSYKLSAQLAEKVLESVSDLYVIDRMSWRPKMKNAVIYLVLNDPRDVFVDLVAGLTVLLPKSDLGLIRLGFTREPATDQHMQDWRGRSTIKRERAWPNPIQDVSALFRDEAEQSLKTYHGLLLELADNGELKRGGTSRPELRMRQLVRRMFPDAGFTRVRPTWLIGSRGKSLELDIFSERMEFAIEVQGPHHFQPIHGDEALVQQVARDVWKRARCAERGIRLLVVDASAIDRELFTLSSTDQAEMVSELIRRTLVAGYFEWPD